MKKSISDDFDVTIGIKPPNISEEQMRHILSETANEPIEELDWDPLKQPYKK